MRKPRALKGLYFVPIERCDVTGDPLAPAAIETDPLLFETAERARKYAERIMAGADWLEAQREGK